MSTSPETVVSSPQNEGANSSRFAIVGLLTPSAHLGLNGIEDEMSFFGFAERLALRQARNNIFEARPEVLRNSITYFRNFQNLDVLRQNSWVELNEGSLDARLAFLTAGLFSELERESAAAAVAMIGTLALSHVQSVEQANRTSRLWEAINWNDHGSFGFPNSHLPFQFTREILDEVSQPRRKWQTLNWPIFDVPRMMEFLPQLTHGKDLIYILNDLAWMRVRLAFRSSDDISRQFVDALTTRPRVRGRHRNVGNRGITVNPSATRPSLTSTMIHGTWGWRGDWWHPDGSFYKYMRRDFRPKLYNDGKEFSWSGAYSDKDRGIAGDRFKRWSESQDSQNGLGTVFAHSYGAEVVARAINDGLKVDEIVFLSAPVNDHLEQSLLHVGNAIDVRLRFDIVLCLAGLFRRPNQVKPRQRFRSNNRVTEFRSRFYYWDHSLTHRRWFWEWEDVANKVGLTRVS